MQLLSIVNKIKNYYHEYESEVKNFFLRIIQRFKTHS